MIAEAAFQLARLVAHRFGVVTTLRSTVATCEQLLLRYGYQHRCSGICATDIPVLSLEHAAPAIYQQLHRACLAAIEQDGAEAIVLGCAGMAELSQRLRSELPVPVIDGVAAAVKLAESLVQLGLVTSKQGQYALPPAKSFIGRYQHWSAATNDTFQPVATQS